MTTTLRLHPKLKGTIRKTAIGILSLLTIILVPVLMFRFLPTPSARRPSITLRQGTFIGTTLSSPTLPRAIDHFLGLPYGESTAGNNRFRPPIRIRDDKGTYDASAYGPRCPAGPGPTWGEDCLRLNVYRPHDTNEIVDDAEETLPVVVYIHGGAFNSGFGHSRDMASFIAHSALPIIGVSVNYRTGAFGFLSGAEAKKDGALNVGLKDMILALQWVQENIGRFGGDKGKVTVMGSSAGAHGIGHLLLLLGRDDWQGEKGDLFRGVVMESGAPTARAVYPFNHALHKQQMSDFLGSLGIQDVDDEDMIEKLRAVPVANLKIASDALFDKYNPSVRWPFQPVIEGSGEDVVIETAPIESWREGKWKKVPILTGFNTNEGAAFVPDQIFTDEQFSAFFRTLLPGLNEADIQELQRKYPDPETDPNSNYLETRRGLGKQFKRTEQAYGQFAYIAPVKHTAQFASSLTGGPPVYLYHFATNCSVKGGADHGTQAPFVEHNPSLRTVSESVNDISGTMLAYWTSFVATGDPNALKGGKYGTRPEWKAYLGNVSDVANVAVFGDGNNELAGGTETGTVVKIEMDTFAREESKLWWDRVDKFES